VDLVIPYGPWSIGNNTNFDFSTFLKIVNCDFAQTFSIDSTHWHGGLIKILHVGNNCKSKKLGPKNRLFAIILKMVWNCGVLSAPVYGEQGALQNSCKKFGDFLKTFPPEGAKFFKRGLLEGPLEIYR